jgi:hypothetical protein
MKLTIEIALDNEAFGYGDDGSEVARILRRLANDMDGCALSARGWVAKLRDVNGNTVGEARVEKGEA